MTSSLAPVDKMIAGLNLAQREAVLTVEGPLLVLAGAGSGKTRVLTTRIAHLIERYGVDPREILAVTFTNKAAGEMRDRIARLLGEEPTGMWVGTFHAIGARIVRAQAHLTGRTPAFTIYDEDDSLAVVKRVMERLNQNPKERSPQVVLHAISDAKNALVAPDEYARLALDAHSKDVAAVYVALEPAMRQANAVSFDDLLTLPVQLFEQHPALLEQYQRRFRYILVDEYQDTNRAQYRFISLLGGAHGNVAVVGDDDQSIYGWRGADIRNILDFEHDFPAARVVRLEENYRSTPQILALANAAISANTERRGKTLRATRPAGDAVSVVAALDERDEAEFVLEEIQGRRFSGRGRPLRDFAVLYRTNAQSRALEEGLRRHGIPYRLIGSVRFYDRREIRDLMAYLKLIANPNDDEAFRRAIAVPRRGVGETSVELLAEAAYQARLPLLAAATDAQLVKGMRPAARTALADFAALITRLRAQAREATVDEVLRELVEAIRYADYLRAEGPDAPERMDNVRELITGAAETVIDDGGEVGLTPLDHFLQRATLVAGVDALDATADAIVLMTLHNAKGLEFPIVFITGLEEGLFPLARAREEPAKLEEERRLFYVGITRAEEGLFITHARSRRRNGELMNSLPSSFVRDLPKGLFTSRATVRLRGSGRFGLDEIGGGGGRPGAGGFGDTVFGSTRFGESHLGASERADWFGERPTPSERRPGTPVSRGVSRPAADEDESQDAPIFAPGVRVKHAKFGEGTIAELTGAGRDAKVTIDFDDESVGRKRLVVAYAGLERGVE
jgi:DNA helicase II / ATP-dependent DNA helicase PcrA